MNETEFPSQKPACTCTSRRNAQINFESFSEQRIRIQVELNSNLRKFAAFNFFQRVEKKSN